MTVTFSSWPSVTHIYLEMGGSFSLPLRVSIVLTVQHEWKGRLQNLLGNSKQTLSSEPLETEEQGPHSQDKVVGYRRVISIAKGKRGAIARTKPSRTNIPPVVPWTASGDTQWRRAMMLTGWCCGCPLPNTFLGC